MVELGPFFPLRTLYGRLADLREALETKGEDVRRLDLRGGDQKLKREAYHSALFARAMMGALSLKEIFVAFPLQERCDFDTVFRWQLEKQVIEMRVQLKELPPEHIASDPTLSLDSMIAKAAAKYGSARDVNVAIFVNRPGHFGRVTVPEHKLGGLFIFGFSNLSPKTLFLNGEVGNRGIQATVPLQLP